MSGADEARGAGAIPAAPSAAPVTGILWMMLAGLLFVGMTATVKHVGQAVPAPQAAFLRFALGLPLALPMLWPLLSVRLTGRQARLFGLRALVHTGGVLCWFFAMTRLPLAEVTAMGYLNPVFVTVGAALLLGERWERRRLLAVGAAFLGALMILRPGWRAVEAGHLAMIGAALGLGGGYLVAKRLSAELEASVVVGMLSVTVALTLLPFAWAVWVPVGAGQVAWLGLTALFATGGHYAMTRAFAAAPLGTTQPATFLQLVWSVLVGLLLFGEDVDPFVIAGGALIVASVAALALRERRAWRDGEGP